MLYNIIDGRKRRHRWQKINAIIEPTWHDNSVQDSDQAPTLHLKSDLVCENKNDISVNEAIKWAEEQNIPVTLYLYDFKADEEE